MISCTLCKSAEAVFFTADHQRDYYRCVNCVLTFVGPDFHPAPEKEKERYRQHQNTIEDKGYATFLQQAINPCLPFLKKEMRILDYGCGPEPALQILLQKHGLDCQVYDPFFYPEFPSGKFNFIFSTEVFEHFFYPHKEVGKIFGLLAPGGYLCIMTEFSPSSEEDFKKWHYIRDFTHVSFYNSETFDFFQNQFGLQKVFSDEKRLILFKKK
jgi:SAM-dependent methyltransferase